MFAILGASGKVGQSTVRALRARGAEVRAVMREGAKAAELAALGCDVAVADVRDAAALARAFDGAEAVQVIVPLSPRAPDASSEMKRAIDATAAALDRARPKATLAISDYGAEHDAGTGITLTFHALETALGRLRGAVTFLRSAEHMQNWARVFGHVRETGVLPSFHHPVTKIFPSVSAHDVGAVAAELLLSPGAPGKRIVHVEGPRRYTPLEVADTLGRLMGREVVASAVPRAQFNAILVAAGLDPSYAQLVVELYDAHNAGRIDAEAGAGEIRRGTTELREVFASLLPKG